MAANFKYSLERIVSCLGCLLYGILVVVGLSSSAPGDRGSGNGPGAFCPQRCICHGGETSPRVNCSHRNLSAVPDSLSALTDTLDLSGNEISQLPEYAFSTLKFLTEIKLDGNQLASLPATTFTGLIQLQKLWLSRNEIAHVADESFEGLNSVQELWMDENKMTVIPVKALAHLTSLRALTLATNKLQIVPNYAFSALKQLAVLLLYDNVISEVSLQAFDGLENLRILELDRNRLTEVPVVISRLPLLEELSISDNDIRYLPENSFRSNKKLKILHLKNNRLLAVHKNTFTNLPHLENLILSEMQEQREFPNLTGTYSLELLALDRGSLPTLPHNLCRLLPKLKSLDVHSNEIREIPCLRECKQLRVLNLGKNELKTLPRKPFEGLTLLRDLTLSHNCLGQLHNDTFVGLPELQYLDLKNNKITEIHPDAFSPLKSLTDLNLGENYFPSLPTRGLDQLQSLNTFKTLSLKDFPSPDAFPKIQHLTLSYAYHCCAFIAKTKQTKQTNKMEIHEDITWLNSHDYDYTMLRNITSLANLSGSYEDFTEEILQGYGNMFDYEYPDTELTSSSQNVNGLDIDLVTMARPPVVCKPMPGPFLPCDDLLEWWSLRCGIWIIFLLALLGNGSVLFISMFTQTKMDVPKFLICNLASADFLMGIYLGFLAIVDASTLGEFKKHAIWWQLSSGCQMAGFLALLSSELSVFTLSVITLERHYAIMHAMYLNKRLSLRQAGYVMVCGWCFCLLLAMLPLFGISDYRKFAVCLPFETEDSISLGFVCFLMLMNGITFLIIVSCYTKVYYSIRSSHAWNTNDSRIAKRMALLVFTDFFCWAPICFFSLTAAFGYELISLNDAKVFTIFVLPLNSCANPFLYAIFTKQFKKDCQHFCRRIDDTLAVSRNLSRASNRNVNAPLESSRILIGLQSLFRIEKRHNANMVTSENIAADVGLPLSSTDRPSIRYSYHLETRSSCNGSRSEINSDTSRGGRSVQFSDAKNGKSLKVGNELLPSSVHLKANGKNSVKHLETNMDKTSSVLSNENLNSHKKPWRFPWHCSVKSHRPHPSLTCSQSQTSSPVTMKHMPFHSISLNFLNRSPVTSKHSVRGVVSDKSTQDASHRKHSNLSDTEQSTDMLELYDWSEGGCVRDDTCSVIPEDAVSGNRCEIRRGTHADGDRSLGNCADAQHCDFLHLPSDSCLLGNLDSTPDHLTCQTDPISPTSVQSDSDMSPCWCDGDVTEEARILPNGDRSKDISALVGERLLSKESAVLQLNGTPCQSLSLLHWHQQNGNCRCITDDVVCDN